MGWLLLALLVVVLCFGLVLLVGAPYLPTLNRQVIAGLDLLDLKPGETLLELGCGDGKVMVAAAKRGLNVVGYELNPILVVISWLRTRRYASQVELVWGDYWQCDWPPAEGVYAFILQRYMTRLDTKIIQQKHGYMRLVSFAFPIKGRKPTKQGNGLYLYIYR